MSAREERGAGGVRWILNADGPALREEACRRILDAAGRALRRHGRFELVLAGGRTPRDIYASLRSVEADWSRWQIYFGDERCLPPDHAERNSRSVIDAWLGHVPIPAHQIHVIPAELGAKEAARAYGEILRDVGDFDLVLLGLGEDGHTASLFPGHDWGADPAAPDVLAVFDAPKPPPERVSLSARRLSRAHGVLFLIEGDSKRRAVTQWRAGVPLPAGAIRPRAGVDVLFSPDLLSP